MTGKQISQLAALEGRQVSLALVDGSRIDDAMLVSAGRGRTRTLWLFDGGADVFVSVADVRDGWEAPPRRAKAA